MTRPSLWKWRQQILRDGFDLCVMEDFVCIFLQTKAPYHGGKMQKGKKKTKKYRLRGLNPRHCGDLQLPCKSHTLYQLS